MPVDDEVPDTDVPTAGPGPSGTEVPASPRASRYTMLREIGRGGMGQVVAATDLTLSREVAIKRLHAGVPTEMQLRRFLREARVQARLDHPAIVPVYELGRDERGLPYIVMKKIAGQTLAQLARSGAPTLQRLLRAFSEVCLAVEYAHVRGVIHRDLKPSNIVLGEFGEVYVLDWGIAKVGDDSDEFSDMAADGDGTLTGSVVGTPAYMSPEQAKDSANVDARSDVYSLGRVLESILEVLDTPPPELTAIADAATMRDRDERTETARDLGEQVQRYLDGDRDLELRRKLAREQLAHAHAAFAAGLREDDRRVAIRAASSAMALDPTLTGAAELVGRLMLEPPRTTPPDVARGLASDDYAYFRMQSRAANWAHLMAIVCGVPLLAIMHAPAAGALLGVVTIIGIAISELSLRVESRLLPRPWMHVVGNALIIMVLAYVFSPLLLAPTAVAIAVTTLAANPYLRSRRSVAALAIVYAATILIPLFAGHLGWSASSVDLVDGYLVMRSIARMEPWMFTPWMLIYCAGLLSAAIVFGRSMRSHELEVRRQLHLQTWQLRQLVADPLAMS